MSSIFDFDIFTETTIQKRDYANRRDSIVYVASPYHHEDPKVIEERVSTFSILWIIAIIASSILGCRTTSMWERNYITPILPKSELATIQIDTQGQWFQGYGSFGMSINKKQAFQEMLIGKNTLSIDDVFVLPGKQNIALLLRTQYHIEGRGKKHQHQTVAYYSIDVKAGSTYILKGELDNDEVCFELIDTDTDQVVSEYITSRETTHKTEYSPNRQSSEVGLSFSF